MRTIEPSLLQEIVDVPGVRCALVLSSDGLLRTQTGTLGRDEADSVAAGCSGLLALANSLQEPAEADGDIRQVVVEWSGGFLFIRGAGDGSRLAVLAGAAVNPALIAQAMAAVVQKLGEYALSTPLR